jgi:hypothetical protein
MGKPLGVPHAEKRGRGTRAGQPAELGLHRGLSGFCGTGTQGAARTPAHGATGEPRQAATGWARWQCGSGRAGPGGRTRRSAEYATRTSPTSRPLRAQCIQCAHWTHWTRQPGAHRLLAGTRLLTRRSRHPALRTGARTSAARRVAAGRSGTARTLGGVPGALPQHRGAAAPPRRAARGPDRPPRGEQPCPGATTRTISRHLLE